MDASRKKIYLYTVIILGLFLEPIHSSAISLKLYSSNEDHPIYGDYAAEIREKVKREDGLLHVDTPRLIEKLKELKVNTYYFLIWHKPSDWDDLRKEFLPAAKKAGINVWVYLVPPSESKSSRSEPYGTDYIAWFQAVGKLSLKYGNLKGIAVDDFNDNTQFFSPYYLKKVRMAGKRENPQLKFYAQTYYPTITPSFIKKYKQLVDGIIMAFRDDHYRNTQRVGRILPQVDEISAFLRNHHIPLVVMIYASKLSNTPTSPTLAYVEGAVKALLHRLKTRQIMGIVTYVLYKEASLELSEDKALRGKGYGSLFSPVNSLPKGAYTELQQQIYINPKGPYQLDFAQYCSQPVHLELNSYQTEILIDHQVVWKKSVKNKNNGKWEQNTVNLTPYLKGKTNAVLSLRLTKHRSGPSSWTINGYDNLIPKGFSLSNNHFEKNQEWTTVCNNQTMIGDIVLFDPKRRVKTFEAIKKYYAAFHIYETTLTYFGDPDLLQTADYFLRSILINQDSEARITLMEMVESIRKNKKASSEKKKLLALPIYQYLYLLKKEVKSKQ